MEPYRVHLNDWTVAMYATDDGRLTFTVTNQNEPTDRLVQLIGEVRLRRHYIGSMCAGTLRPTPFIASVAPYVDPPTISQIRTKEAVLAAEGAG